MSTISNTQVLWHPQNARKVSVRVNGHDYITDGDGRLSHVLAGDVAAVTALGYLTTAPRDLQRPISDYGKG
jgi:hypothetical protein